MDKRFMAILAALIIIFGGLFFFISSGDDSDSGRPTNHVFGKANSSVNLTEYGDFQCPVCESYEPIMSKVRQTYAKKIQFQFRNLPLVQIHPNAFSAARAAEAAGLQDKYWPMHDALYEPSNWQVWTAASNPVPNFDSYARQLGLNVDQFKQDYASSRVNAAINADLAEFKKTGQQMATPTFFLNGEHLANSKLTDPNTGQPSFAKFKAVLDAAIRR